MWICRFSMMLNKLPIRNYHKTANFKILSFCEIYVFFPHCDIYFSILQLGSYSKSLWWLRIFAVECLFAFVSRDGDFRWDIFRIGWQRCRMRHSQRLPCLSYEFLVGFFIFFVLIIWNVSVIFSGKKRKFNDLPFSIMISGSGNPPFDDKIRGFLGITLGLWNLFSAVLILAQRSEL